MHIVVKTDKEQSKLKPYSAVQYSTRARKRKDKIAFDIDAWFLIVNYSYFMSLFKTFLMRNISRHFDSELSV